MPCILSIETSTNVCSIAVHQHNLLFAQEEYHINNSHSELLVPIIKQMLKNANIKVEEIDAVAVSEGPGSYTGLRIGTSTAKAFCYMLNKKLIAVNTLDAMSLQVVDTLYQKGQNNNILLCPMIDARRMEVYCQVTDTKLNKKQDTTPKIINKDSFIDILSKNKMIFFGNGAAKCKDTLSYHTNAMFIDGLYPTAKYVGKIACNKYNDNQFENVIAFEPVYLKKFTTQIKRKK